MVRKVFLAFLMLFMTAACSDPPKSGYVVSKEYDDPDDWVYMHPIYTQTCTGGYSAYSPRTCYQHMVGMIPIHGHDDAHWEFRIKDDKDPKGKKHGWVEVTQETYDSYQVGVHWPDAR